MEAQEEKAKFAVEEGDHITYLNGIITFFVNFRFDNLRNYS